MLASSERYSERGSYRYRQRRELLLPRMLDYSAQLAGLSSLTITVDRKRMNECKLTEDGARVHLNPKSVEEILYRRWFGVVGTLPLEVADMITSAHLVGLARDFSDPSFFIEVDREGILERGARKYFNACFDDTVIDRRLARIPLFSRFFDAFSTRLLEHDMSELPRHVQFINAVRFLVIEVHPSFVVAPDVQEALDVLRKPGRSIGSEVSLRELFSDAASYQERHARADRLLYPCYLDFVKEDRRAFDAWTLGTGIYPRLSFFNTFMNVTLKDLKKLKDFDESAYIDELYQVTEEFVDETIEERIKDAPLASDDECIYEVPNLILPRRDASSHSLDVTTQVLSEYLGVVRQWHTTISDVADLFLRLAAPEESIMVPRYRHIRASDGIRISPSAIIDAYLQLATGSPRAIWQPLIKEVRYQELRFSGLDIFILLDVSASMGGANAEYASAMAVCLIEGLQVARYRAEVEALQGTIDVRTQLLAFGASWAELTELCKEPTLEQRETAYFNLMNPGSNVTQIQGALKHVRLKALETPGRDIVCLVVSDGLFSDNFEAFRTVKEMPHNVYVGHISIGSSTGIPITPHHEKVSDPRALPKRLYAILEEYLQTIHNRA